jgi:hypothetical protein
LRPTKSVGLDDIALFVMKVGSEICVPFVKFIFNLSSLMQTLSAAWEKTTIFWSLKRVKESLFVIIGLFPLSVPFSEVYEFVTYIYINHYLRVI